MVKLEGTHQSLPIEQWFSFVRGQSPNSQVSARGYFQASARVTLKHGQKLTKQVAELHRGEEPLSEEQFLGDVGGDLNMS